MPYPLSSTTWGTEELAAIDRVTRSGRFTMGDQVRRFEEKLPLLNRADACMLLVS